jgi:type III secretory pathway component EscT
MRQYEAIAIGIVMGLLYGIILKVSVDTFSMASFILYKDLTLIPIATTFIIIGLAFLCMFSYPYWAPQLEQMIVYSITKENEEDEDE